MYTGEYFIYPVPGACVDSRPNTRHHYGQDGSGAKDLLIHSVGQPVGSFQIAMSCNCLSITSSSSSYRATAPNPTTRLVLWQHSPIAPITSPPTENAIHAGDCGNFICNANRKTSV